MSIHSEHPFATADADRSPLRRFRGRMTSAVSVWAAGEGARRAGWTVSSFLLAEGEPGEVLGVLDEDSDLAERLTEVDTFTVTLLGWDARQLADAFAGQAPAPGGVFRIGRWTDSDWGPVLDGAAGWLGVRRQPGPVDGGWGHAGWGQLVRGTVEHAEVGPLPADGLLAHVRGRYRAVGAD